MKTIAVLSLSATLLFLVGCDGRNIERSDVLQEQAVVVDLVFMPANHSSGISPTFHMAGDTPKVGFKITSVNIPEKYAVVFECQHGKFIIGNSEHDQGKAKELYQRLHRDEKTIVTYREVYEVVKKGEQIKARTLIKFDFIDAQPLREELKPESEK